VSEPLLERIRQSETTKLYPCLVLFGALTAFKDKRKSRQASGDPVCESRRDFLDSFAYLCDTRKGGGTVTAAALQELQNSNFLWLAANDGISDDLLDYAKTMINRLRSINAENQSAVKDDLFKLAMDKCTDRIQFYKDRVQILARNCRMKLRAWEQDETGKDCCVALLSVFAYTQSDILTQEAQEATNPINLEHGDVHRLLLRDASRGHRSDKEFLNWN
jgi:hypothetical protein